MKIHLNIAFLFVSCLAISCSTNDDDPATPGTNETGFITPISQAWIDTAGTNTYFFGNADSTGRFTGNETDNNGNQNFLLGKTYRFDVSFTVIKDQFSNYVDYTGKLTDTSATHKRIVVYSKTDTLYLKPQ
ncbi:MAG: hypothetical protein JNK61_00350 [Bacteroidia bacterium]|nr:hypothetical protein [Bacteroidia bacterium]HQV00566.1 hypothetical protein [Bacteroidia bacterium]